MSDDIRALVVDDERPAREELVWLLGQCGGVDIAAQAANADDAMTALEEHDVDLVFLDIDMPGVDGMRLAELLHDGEEEAPLVVFVTAYDNFAVDAFDVDAVDYVLKPVRLERLQKTLDKVRARLAPADGLSSASETDKKPLTRISVEDRDVYRVIPVEEILFFESEHGIVVAQTDSGDRYITDFSLKFLEENLDPEAFFRSHRSYIVRLDTIDSIAPWGAGTYRLMLDRENDLGVPLARSRASELKSLIPWSASVFD